MISDINNILIIKYLRNELSDAEKQTVLRWLEEKEENQQFLFGLKEVYQLSKWEEMRIQANTIKEWEALQDSLLETEKNKPTKIRKWLLYATAAIICFVIGFGFNRFIIEEQSTLNILKTSSGEQSTLILSDGTKVKLNANSKLIYPADFAKKSRTVTLQGEAYFEVAHNQHRPFEVNIGTYSIRVLGTKFNINAYPNQRYIYTSLKEGRIQIIDNTPEKKILSELKPGMQLNYNKLTGEYFVQTIDMELIADWINGLTVIRHQSLLSIKQQLENIYGYSIKIQNPKICALTYNITIDKEPLEEILNNIHFVTPQVSFSINQHTKTVILK